MKRPKILVADTPQNHEKWLAPLRRALHNREIKADIHIDNSGCTDADYVVYSPKSGLLDFSPFTNLKGVFSTWAGVESIVGNSTISVPLTRMVDPGLTEGMVEYCLGHLLRYHLDIDAHTSRYKPNWRPDLLPKLARNRRVGLLGLGALGQAVATAATALRFDVHGWSRRPKSISGITTHSGPNGLDDVLALAEVLILLLPHTHQTNDLMDAKRLARLPKGACIINPGRGALIVDDALIAALDTGSVAHATLDVFRTEPLPSDNPFWHHPRVTVTPHIAAETRPETAAEVIAENVRRAIAGEPLLHLVDRTAGY